MKIKQVILVLLLASPASAVEPPNLIYNVNTSQDAQAVMDNDRALADAINAAIDRIDDLEAGSATTTTAEFAISRTSVTVNQATTSVSYIDVTNSTATISIASGNRLLVFFFAQTGQTANGASCFIRLLIDGSPLDGGTVGGCQAQKSAAEDREPCAWMGLTDGLSSGTHTGMLQFKSNGSDTCTLRSDESATSITLVEKEPDDGT